MYQSKSRRSNFGMKKTKADGSRDHSFSRSFGPKKFSSNNSNRSSRPGGYSRFGGGNNRRPSRRPRGEHIDVSKFIMREVPESCTKNYESKNTFADFHFCSELNFNLNKKEYTSPTPIQDQAIGQIMAGRDLIGLANTGTGKTAAFLLPLINKINHKRYEKVLIIAPTRELAMQIDNELRAFSAGMQLFSAVCVGGMPIRKQIFNLKRNPNFVIGTPGRLKDLSQRKLIRFEQFQNIVLDEVDRMLDMGFVNEITDILNALPERRQALFFSATLPPKIQTLVQQFLKEPIRVEVKTGDTAANVLQDIVRVSDQTKKFDTLKVLLSDPQLKKVLIFSETKREVEKLASNLTNVGFRAESIHGNKRQSQRTRSLDAFKRDDCKILVATDVAARGLDIGDISHVINYTIPMTYNDYVHRIGRTGRGDKIGQALTFVE